MDLSDAQLFRALAKAAERCMGDFKAQEVANTAWAFATGGQSDGQLFTALARVAERRMDDFNTKALHVTFWALWREGLNDAWSLLDHMKHMDVFFILLCSGALSMECEQSGLFAHEIALLKGLEGAAGKRGAEMGFGAATKRIAAMCVAKANDMKLPHPQGWLGVHQEACSATSVCIWCACHGWEPPPPLDV